MRTMQMNPIGGKQMENIRVKEVEMDDPTFEDGTVHVAHITFTNPKKQAITYKATLYLADPTDITIPITSSDEQSFTIAAEGTSEVIDFSIMTPLLGVTQATFVACCVITVAGVPVITFVGSEEVIVNFSPSINWGGILWD